MKQGNNGLRLISEQGTSYPYVLVGWVRLDGDEVEIFNARVIRRFGANQFLAGLAANGPAKDTQLGPMADEDTHRINVHRNIKANPEAWAKECPKPKGWE